MRGTGEGVADVLVYFNTFHVDYSTLRGDLHSITINAIAEMATPIWMCLATPWFSNMGSSLAKPFVRKI